MYMTKESSYRIYRKLSRQVAKLAVMYIPIEHFLELRRTMYGETSFCSSLKS